MFWKLCGLLHCVLKRQYGLGAKRSWLSQLITHAPSRKYCCLQCGLGLYKLDSLVSKKLCRAKLCVQYNSAGWAFKLKLTQGDGQNGDLCNYCFAVSPLHGSLLEPIQRPLEYSLRYYHVHGNPTQRETSFLHNNLCHSGTELGVTWEMTPSHEALSVISHFVTL